MRVVLLIHCGVIDHKCKGHGIDSKGDGHQKHIDEDREGGGCGMCDVRCGVGMCGGCICCSGGHCCATSTSIPDMHSMFEAICVVEKP